MRATVADRDARGPVVAAARRAGSEPDGPVPGLARGTAAPSVQRLRGPVALVRRGARGVLALDLGPLRGHRPRPDRARPGAGTRSNARGDMVPGRAAELRRARPPAAGPTAR